MENSSEALLERFVQGSERAAFELHDRYYGRVIGLAQKRLTGWLQSKVDADDISQQTFQTFFEMADRGDVRWQKQGDLWRLLAGIAVNKARNAAAHYDADKRSLHREQSANPNDGAIDHQAAVVLSEYVQHLIATEKPILRIVLTLRLAGYSQAEIARHTGRSTRTIRRFIDALKARMAVENRIAADLMLQRSDVADLVVDYSGYQLLKMIGVGSFGKVYLAKQNATGRLFALKVIRRKWLYHLDAQQTFVREASLLASLDHPNIVKCFGVGTIPGGGCFLVLELIQGVVWNEAVQSASDNEILNWIMQLTDAIRYVHGRKIVHGDIRPANLIINSGRQLRVVDFGLGNQLRVKGQQRPADELRAIMRIVDAISFDHRNEHTSVVDAVEQIKSLLRSSTQMTAVTCDKIARIIDDAS